MSATVTSSTTRIRTIARSYSSVIGEIGNSLLRVADHYGVHHGILASELEDVLKALLVWVTVKQLEAVTLEFVGRNGLLIRKCELRLDYSETDDEDEQMESDIDLLEAFLAKDRPEGIVRYRLLLSLNTDRPVQVAGWKVTKFSDDTHLERREVTPTLVGTKCVRSNLVMYIDPPHQTKDE